MVYPIVRLDAMIVQQTIIKRGAQLLLQGKSIFELEDYLKQNGIDTEERTIFIDEMILYSEMIRENRESRLKGLKLIFGTILLTLLIFLFILGFLGFVGIGIIGALLIFWILQSLGIFKANRPNRGKFNRR